MTWPSLPQYLKNKAAEFGARVFLCDFDTEIQYTYREFDELTDQMAGWLRGLGVEVGDRVALLHPNHSDFILAYCAIIKAGAVAVPVNPLYTSREILHILGDSGAGCLISTQAFVHTLKEVQRRTPHLKRILVKEKGESLKERLERESRIAKPFAAPDRSPDDPAFIFYTSGTTGRPKGVMLTHRNFTFGGANTAQSYGLRETDISLAPSPRSHFCQCQPCFRESKQRRASRGHGKFSD